MPARPGPNGPEAPVPAPEPGHDPAPVPAAQEPGPEAKGAAAQHSYRTFDYTPRINFAA